MYTSPVSDLAGAVLLAGVVEDKVVVTVDTVVPPTDSDDPEDEETEHLSNCCLQLVRLSEQL